MKKAADYSKSMKNDPATVMSEQGSHRLQKYLN